VIRRAVVVVALVWWAALPAAAQTKNWPSERPPRPLRAHDVKFPPYAFRTLPNGLQVVAVSHHEQPAVSLRLIVRAGTAQDPENRPGVASLLATLLDQGTTTKSAEQIAQGIDSIGGALGTGAVSDLTFINAVVMKDSLGVGLDFVSDIAQHPGFAPEEIDRQRQQILSSLKVSYDDPDYLADMVFERLVYGFNPYGRPQSGTPATIASIGRDDLVAFHRKWFGPNNAILAIVGDVSADEAFAGAQRAFGNWRRAQADAPSFVDPPPPTRRLVVIDRPGAVQTEIRVGNVGIPRKHDDYMALDLAVKILGGEGANRLHRVLRTERGLTYGASADMNGMKQSGDIVAETNTRSETTGETLRLMVDEFWRLIRDRVSDRELSGAQDYLTGSFPLTIETPSQIATQVLNAVFYGLDLDELQTYRERVNGVTAEDVQRVARGYLHPDRLTIVLVGDASAFLGQLPRVGFDRFERIPLAELDLSSADLRRPATAPVGEVMPAAYREAAWTDQGDTPEDLVRKAIAAKGGAERLRSITTVQAETSTRLETDQGPRTFPAVTSIQYPDRYRIEADTPAGRLVQVYADGAYWIQDARGVHDAPDAVRAEIRAAVQRDLVPLLLEAASGRLRIAKARSDDPSLDAISVSAPKRQPVTVYVDPSTGLVAMERYDAPDASGTVEERYSDYRDVDGLKVAFKTTVRRPGAPLVERSVLTFRCNVPLSPSLFLKPAS
jgi:zinc protease